MYSLFIMKVFKTIGKILLVILLVPIIIPLLLISIVGSIIDIPFAKKRKRQIEELPEKLFLPNKRYAYIQYATDGPLSGWIKKEVVDKYGDKLVVDCWNQEEFNWQKPSWDKIDKKTGNLLVGELSPDCDGLASFFVVGINPETKLFDTENELYLFGPPTDERYTANHQDKEYSETEVKQLIENHMKQLFGLS